MNSQRVPPCSAREPLPSASTGGGRGNCDQSVGQHGLTASKLSDELREYLANQPRLVLIGVNGTARPFEFIDHRPFHGSAR